MIFEKNVVFKPAPPLSSWRKTAIGTWRTAGDPSVYGMVEANLTQVLRYLDSHSTKSQKKLTLTHFFGRCIAEIYNRHPELNSMIRFGKLCPRKDVDIFFQVAADTAGSELSGLVIRQAHQKSIEQIAAELEASVHDIRHAGDPSYRKMKSFLSKVPALFTSPLISLTGFILYNLNLWSPLMGIPRDPFGSAMLTNIGSLDLEMAFAPLVPWSRTPMVLAIGAVKDRAVVQNGQIVSAPISRLCFTFDHRLIDGVHASRMIKSLNAILDNPEKELD